MSGVYKIVGNVVVVLRFEHLIVYLGGCTKSLELSFLVLGFEHVVCPRVYKIVRNIILVLRFERVVYLSIHNRSKCHSRFAI